MPAVGVTDTANLFGALEFSEKAAERRAAADHRLQAAGPLRGGKRTRRAPPRPRRGRRASTAPLFLLCATEEGYRDLIKLVSFYYLGETARRAAPARDDRGRGARAHRADRRARRRALSACRRRRIGPRRNAALGAEAGLWRPALCRAWSGTAWRSSGARRPASSTSPTGSTCRSSPPTSRSSRRATIIEAHDALLAIAEGRLLSERRPPPAHAGPSLRRAAPTMMRRFADMPEALENTVEIALRCAYAAADRAADPAALRHGAVDGGSRPSARKRRSCAGRREAGLAAAPCGAWAARRATTRRTTATGSPSSSASSRR